MTEISLSGRGARGESQADILRRTGQFGVLPTDTDAEAVGKLNADAAASAALAERTVREKAPARQIMNSGLTDPRQQIIYDDGTVQPVVDAAGDIVTPDGSGGIAKAALRKRRALSPGLIDGEAIAEFERDTAGNVVAAFGVNGGHWRWTENGWTRVNSSVMLVTPSTTYTAEAYTSGMQERLHRADQAVAYIFVVLGQSNADGQEAGTEALISAAATYPTEALMLAGGPRVRTSSGAVSLVPLVETIVSAQRETPASGWVNHFIRDYEGKFAARPTVTAIVAAEGNRSYAGLKRGSTAYRELEIGLARAVAALKLRGFMRFKTVLGWLGGESDTDQVARMTPSRYAAQMDQFASHLSETVRALTGEIADPPLFMVQPGYTPYGVWSQTVREGMRLAHRRGACLLAGAGYQFAMTDAAGDPIHRSNTGKYTSGQMLARATMAEVLGTSWHPIMPRTAYWTGNTTLAVEFDNMGTNLVLDTSGATINTASLNNHGFDFDDASGAAPAITGVAVSGQTVTVTLAAKPTGPCPRLAYACRRNGAATGYGPPDGPVVGARGTLRDDLPHVRLSDSSNQYDWCPAFIIDLPVRS